MIVPPVPTPDIQNDSPSTFEKVSRRSNESARAAAPNSPAPAQINSALPSAVRSTVKSTVPSALSSATSSSVDRFPHARPQPVYDTGTLGIQVSYPRLSRVFEEQGQVILNIFKNSDNSIEKITIEKSSGFSRLDDAALEAAKHHDFSKIETSGEFKISFVFKLK